MSSSWEKYCYASNESGRTEFFGGPVVAAVYLNKEVLEKLKKEEYYSEIKAAKNCGSNWILKYVPQIIKILKDNYEYLIIFPKEYNELFAKYGNMNRILSLLHNEVNWKLQNKLKQECFRVTNHWVKLEKHYEYLKDANIESIKVDEMPLKSVEKYLGCALASIIARYYYLEQMSEMSQKYGVKIPTTISDGKDIWTISVYQKLAQKAKPEEFCKTNFKTVEVINTIHNENYDLEKKENNNIEEQKHIVKKSPNWEKYCYASDESGKGDFFGGPVVAAVYLNKEVLESLRKEVYYSEIKDSKQCTDNWIYKCAPQIMEALNNNYEYLITYPKEYNELYSKYQNMNVIFSVLHNNVHLKLQNKLKIDAYRVLDRWTTLNSHYRYLSNLNIKAVKVDDMCNRAESKYLACALASIIARYYYLEQMSEMSQKYVVRIPLGNSYTGRHSVITAFKELKKKAKPEEFCKTNFKTVEVINEFVGEDSVNRKCPECNSDLVYRLARKAGKKFIGCSGYPICKYAENIVNKEDLLNEKCPECSAQLIKKINSKNKPFVGCSAFPKCRYIKPASKKD